MTLFPSLDCFLLLLRLPASSTVLWLPCSLYIDSDFHCLSPSCPGYFDLLAASHLFECNKHFNFHCKMHYFCYIVLTVTLFVTQCTLFPLLALLPLPEARDKLSLQSCLFLFLLHPHWLDQWGDHEATFSQPIKVRWQRRRRIICLHRATDKIIIFSFHVLSVF